VGTDKIKLKVKLQSVAYQMMRSRKRILEKRRFEPVAKGVYRLRRSHITHDTA